MHRTLKVAASTVLLALTGSAQDILFGVQSTANVLVRIDTATLVATPIGPVGFTQIGGLAFGNDGTLYGISASSDQLIRIDTTTGAGTAIGPVGRAITFSTGLGHDRGSDELFGIAQGGIGLSSVLVTYDKTTGLATTVGDTGASAVVGLDCDASGQLWGIDGGGGHEELIRIDKATGATTVVGPMGLAAYAGIGSFDIGPSGTLWAVNLNGSTLELIRVDSATGAPTLVGAITGLAFGGGITGLASRDCPPTSAVQQARNGTPPNPMAYLLGTAAPVVGQTWNPRIDHTTFVPNAVADFLLLGGGRANLSTPFGTLLCDLTGGLFLVLPPQPSFRIPIPGDCRLVGAVLCTQAGSTDGAFTALTNAIDVRLGSQ